MAQRTCLQWLGRGLDDTAIARIPICQLRTCLPDHRHGADLIIAAARGRWHSRPGLITSRPNWSAVIPGLAVSLLGMTTGRPDPRQTARAKVGGRALFIRSLRSHCRMAARILPCTRSDIADGVAEGLRWRRHPARTLATPSCHRTTSHWTPCRRRSSGGHLQPAPCRRAHSAPTKLDFRAVPQQRQHRLAKLDAGG